MLLLAGSAARRAELQHTGEFCPPDPRALMLNVGPMDCSAGFGCVQGRVAEALSLLQHHDLALAYTEDASLTLLRRFDARIQMALTRGLVLAARGDAEAASVALERAAAAAREAGMVVEEARALQLLRGQLQPPEGGGGARSLTEGGARLAAVLRRMTGTPGEISSVFPDRDNVPTLDAEALFAAYGR